MGVRFKIYSHSTRCKNIVHNFCLIVTSNMCSVIILNELVIHKLQLVVIIVISCIYYSPASLILTTELLPYT